MKRNMIVLNLLCLLMIFSESQAATIKSQGSQDLIQFAQVTDDNLPQPDNRQIIVETNGISMRLERTEIRPAQVEFMLCYTKPDEGIWRITGSDLISPGLFIGTVKATYDKTIHLCASEISKVSCNLTRINRFPEMDDHDCCELISFQTDLIPEEITQLQLSIPSLSLKLMPDVPPEMIRAAKEKTAPLGIEWEFNSEKDIFGISNVEIIVTKTPAGMDEAGARSIIHHALSAIWDGPWLFEFALR